MVCFSGGMDVEGLEVDCSLWCSVLFGADDHAMAPCDFLQLGQVQEPPVSHLCRGRL